MADPVKRGRRGFGSSLFEKASLRTVLSYAGMALLLAVAIAILGREIGHHVRAIEAWIAELGPWGPVAFVVLFVATTTVFVPETVLAIMAGALFGLGGGLAAVAAGGFAAAVVQFLLARRVLRTRIERTVRSRPSLAALQGAVAQSGVRLQMLLRLTPLNPTTLSYMFGAAGVRPASFLAACVALVPNMLIEVYFGFAGRHVAKMAGRTASGVALHDAVLVGGLVACVVAMVVVSRTARRAVAGQVAAMGEARAGQGAPPDGSTAAR